MYMSYQYVKLLCVLLYFNLQFLRLPKEDKLLKHNVLNARWGLYQSISCFTACEGLVNVK